MVLHDHQANPHVHLSVRAESRHGTRLNPRKADLRRWRETFAEKLRGWGVDAEATRQATRGGLRKDEPLWRIKAAEDGRLLQERKNVKASSGSERTREDAAAAWAHIVEGLAASDNREDRTLADEIDRYVRVAPFAAAYARQLDRQRDERLATQVELAKARAAERGVVDRDIGR
jgi:hypothetical protein